MISVVFTCKGRPALTELCLRRLVELMPEPYKLFVCYDGDDSDYINMIMRHTKGGTMITNPNGESRFVLINKALERADGDLFMHVENDFYWVDPMCLDVALNAFHRYPDLDYVRFEHLPFTHNNFYQYLRVDGKDVCWMRGDSDYRFTFNPHIRKFKYPTDEPFKTEGFTKQPEQHHNDGYKYQSACMTGDNWRHLGIFSEGGHYKPHYGERFYNVRGKELSVLDLSLEFGRICPDEEYRSLFKRYLIDNRHQHSS